MTLAPSIKTRFRKPKGLAQKPRKARREERRLLRQQDRQLLNAGRKELAWMFNYARQSIEDDQRANKD
jgi:hypothetical protein